MTAISVGLTVAILQILRDEPSGTIEIDRDRQALNDQLTSTRADAAKYSGGLIKSLIEVRVQVIQNTLSMLDQKRASILKRISLHYTIAGDAVTEATDTELIAILKEIEQAEARATASRTEAERYSGGLVHAMALAKAATDDLSVSQLRLKFYSAKHGLSLIPIKGSGPSSSEPEPALGKNIVSDKDAL